MPTQRYDPAIRARAIALGEDRRMTREEIREKLRSETGIDVPPVTIGRWRRDGVPVLDVPTSAELADRALALLSSEMGRIERQRRPDLERLAKVASILKTIETTRQAPKRKARTLADLNRDEPSSEAEGVRLAA